jgi:hypothetical protein
VEKESISAATALEPDERRQHQRIEPEGATVQLAGRDGTPPLSFEIDNLSEGGALIVGRMESPAGEGATLQLSILLAGAAPIPMPVRVIRNVSRGGKDFTALMFLRDSPELGHWIEDVVLQGLRAAFPEL